MFQPQPTPYASFAYGGLPEYTYHQQTQQLAPGAPLGETNAGSGGLQVGGAGGGGLPFGGGIGASGAGATGPPLALASGPTPGASPLLFISPAFNSGPEAGHFHSSFNANANPNNFSPHLRINNVRIAASRRQRTKMDDSEVSADLAAQEAAAREYQPQLEVRDCYLSQ
jgi:hypothetical protein